MSTKEPLTQPVSSRSLAFRSWWQSADRSHLISLIIGDIVVFMVFAVSGMNSHKIAINALNVFLVALPFIAAWFIVAPFTGAFRRDLAAQPRKMAVRTLLSWLVAWPVSMLLRGIFVDHTVPPWTFMLIALIANAVFLLIWRVPFALVRSRRRS
jgi:hypothetical protein